MGKAKAGSGVPELLPHRQQLVTSPLPQSRTPTHPRSPLPKKHLQMGPSPQQMPPSAKGHPPPSRWRWLTNGPRQGDDHFLAGGLLRDTADNPLDPIHPDLQLHLRGCWASGTLGHHRMGCLRGERKPCFHPKPLMRSTRCFKSGVIKSSLLPASHKVHPRPSSCSLLPSIHLCSSPCAQTAFLLILLKH